MTSQNKKVLLSLLLGSILCLALLIISVTRALAISEEQQAAQTEYQELQSQFSPLSADRENPTESLSAFAYDLLTINPDYIGWLTLSPIGIDHPVVRGADNQRYLSTTFEGSQNPSGALFMDCQNTMGFDASHVVIYGHHMKNGTLFGNLGQYLDAEFLRENPTITVITVWGEALEYQIFSAGYVDAYDSCYTVTFTDEAQFSAFSDHLSAPQGSRNILTLSTCAQRGDKDERIVLHAVRQDTMSPPPHE